MYDLAVIALKYSRRAMLFDNMHLVEADPSNIAADESTISP